MRINKLTRCAAAAVGAMAISALSASGAVFFDTGGFSAYSAGPIQGQVGWSNEAGGGGATIVGLAGGNLALQLDSANNGQYGRYFGPGSGDSGNVIPDGTPAYLGFTFIASSLPTTAAGAAFMDMGIAGSTPANGAVWLFVKPNGSQYQIGVSNGSGGAATADFSPTLLDVGTKYSIVDKYLADITTRAISNTLWINPVDESSAGTVATAVATEPGAINGINRIQVAQSNFFYNDNKAGIDLIDDLKVATTFAEAVTIVPEPASLSLLSLGALTLMRRRRR